MANRTKSVSTTSIISRVVAATVGGYLAANLGAIVISYLIPGALANAVGVGLQISFLIYACAVLWVFSARSACRAWLGLLVPGICCTALILLLMPEGLI